MALWVPTLCAEVDVNVQQILGVFRVPRNLVSLFASCSFSRSCPLCVSP